MRVSLELGTETQNAVSFEFVLPPKTSLQNVTLGISLPIRMLHKVWINKSIDYVPRRGPVLRATEDAKIRIHRSCLPRGLKVVWHMYGMFTGALFITREN